MRLLVLVKHGAPEIVPTIPAREWRLSATGRARCMSLAQHLRTLAPANIVASTEPKAAETAELVAGALGTSWSCIEGLHKHDRSNTAYLGATEFETRVAQFFAEPDTLVFGRETAVAACERFSDAIARVLGRHSEGNLAVVAHGTVITLFVARTNPIDAFTFWRELGLPSYVVVSVPDCHLVDVTGQFEPLKE